MGLDMYLSAKRYISSHFNEGDDERAKAIQEMFPELAGREGNWSSSPVKEIKVDAGYWRKANAVHDWFVREVQGGEDDCGYYFVGREQLTQLKELCEQVLQDRKKAADLLPTTSGFFFGSTDYDDWYFQDIESTVNIVKCALEMPASWEFEYHSSW